LALKKWKANIEAECVHNDKRLAQRMANGDRNSYAEFVDAYGSRIHQLVQRYADGKTDAEDLTQEIFIDLYRCIGSFRGDSALSTWVYRIAVNHCLKYRDRKPPATVAYDDALQTETDRDGNPEEWTARRELSDHIHGALDDLSPPHRDVVILHELHGLTYSECAAILNVPIGTVKSRLSNAFRRLRDTLGAYVLDSGQTAATSTVTESA
jgi:RNA polymerase sigma-70 factor, ECF subfamily